MNIKGTSKRLKIILSVGDESGVGPEIILKALYSHELPKNIQFIIVGSKINLQNTYSRLRSLGFARLCNPRDLRLLYVFCRFFFEATNIKSIFFGSSCELRAFKIISGPTPDSSPTLNTILNLLLVF